MTTQLDDMAAKAKRQRADKPMKLIATPRYATGHTDTFTMTASHMALLHNAIIRGFNSIYLQALHVQDLDRRDFVGYARAWYDVVKAHHEEEEEALFRKVEALLEDRSIFTPGYMEYKSILPRLEEYKLYLSSLPTPSHFSGTKLIRIMDTFRQQLEQHLHHEITVITSLSTHPRVHAMEPNTPEAKTLTTITSTWSYYAATKAGITDVVPFLMLNMDKTVEGGMWESWPQLSMPYKWAMLGLGGAWNGGWWLFTSCDGNGKPRKLHALHR